jgi:hypothetical protein
MQPLFASEAMVNPAGAVVQQNGTVVAYSQLGGFVTNGDGVLGTVTSTLGVNFDSQTVNTTVDATIAAAVGAAGGRFSAVANGVAMDEGAFFWAGTGNAPRHALSLVFTPNQPGEGLAFGTINGALMGPGMNGAGVAFAFVAPMTGDRATGTVVFGDPTYSTGAGSQPFSASGPMEHRLGIVASGMNAAGAVTFDGRAWTGDPSELVSEWDNYRVTFGANAPSRLQLATGDGANPSGSLLKFDARLPVPHNPCGEPGCWDVNEAPAVFAISESTGFGPTATHREPAPTARVLEFGRDPVTGISWGRWGGGLMNVGDRNTLNQAGSVDGASAIDLTANNLHYVLGPSMSAPIVLPVSGTFSYSFVGGTSPTAFTPGQIAADVGTLASASLTANFTAKTVDVAVSASTPASGAWAASATSVPILANTAFFAEKTLNGGGGLSVTRNGSAENTAGQIVGKFAGPTGQGAAFGYALNQGGPTGTTISGVAAFRR